MSIPLPPRTFICLILMAFALGMTSGPAAAADRNVIRIRGRVVDRAGKPLPETWVVTLGSRRTGAIVGRDGSYLLSVPGATLAELKQVPLKLRVQARRKDHRMGLPGGEPELGLELSVVTDSVGATWFQVRSNDAAIAEMMANAAVLESSTRVELKLDFVGSRGVPDTDEAVLGTMERVQLTGPTIPPPAPVAAKAVETAPPVAAVPPPAPSPRSVVESVATERGESNLVATEQDVETRPAETKRAETKPDESKPRVVRPGLAADETAPEPAEKPRVIRPGATPEETAREAAERARKKPRARAATAEEVLRLLEANPDLAHELPGKSPRAVTGAAPGTSGGAPGSGASSASPQKPKGGPTARAIPAPAVNEATRSAASNAAPPVAAAVPADESFGVGPCMCRIEGTIEISSDRPLPERMQVVISLESDAKIKDTVELFMGSPREFVLPGVPCGPQRLRFKTKSKQKFVLTTEDPMVDCTGGGFRQIKLTLEPITRWRVSK